MASPKIWSELLYFSEKEFRHPEVMEDGFLLVLDKARGYAGIPFKLNSDGRLKTENTGIADAAKHSVHLLGRAVDIDVNPNDFDAFTRILTGVLRALIHFNLVHMMGLKVVNGPKESYIHFDIGGVHPDGFIVPRPWLSLGKE